MLFCKQINKPPSTAEGNELLRIWADRIQRTYDDIITVQIPLPTLCPTAHLNAQQRSDAEYRLYAVMPKVITAGHPLDGAGTL
jgi:hypothetical protein